MIRDRAVWQPLLDAEFYRSVEARLREGRRGTACTGLVEGARALVVGLLAAGESPPLLLVVPDDSSLEHWRRDLAGLAPLAGCDPQRIAVFPALDADPYDGISPHSEVVRERVVALDLLRRREVDLLVTPVRAALTPLPSPREWTAWSHTVETGVQLPPDRFVLDMLGAGYRRVDVVSAPGEISRRGGIVDVFPPTTREPVRIEWFGDEVESLRAFDTDHQRSTGKIERVAICPASENPRTEATLKRLAAWLEGGVAKDDGPPPRELRERLDVLRNHGYWPGAEALARLSVERPSSLFDHAPDLAVVVDEPSLGRLELDRAFNELEASHASSEQTLFPAPGDLFFRPEDVAPTLDAAAVFLQELAGDEPEQAEVVHPVSCRESRSYSGRMHEVVDDLRAGQSRRERTVFAMRAAGSVQRLLEILADSDLAPAMIGDAARADADPLSPGGLFAGVAALREGFEFPELGLIVLAERNIFGEVRKVADRKRTGRAAFVSDFRDLKKGDLLVHVDHGVARFGGLGRPKGGSLNRDFMVLEFAKGDRLFVPVDRLDLVQKYSGAGSTQPTLDRLGGPGWEKVKSRVRKAVESMAKELLELYARRKAASGHAFSSDTTWQAELESAFPYELTPDQDRAVQDIKRDMESDRPADRLLVGDVGYGKTEVAVRAAFKAVMDGCQVAVLAPTTVLAAQHFETFRARYASFPVRVEMVSRFRSAAEQKQAIHDLVLGSVDVIIGTHRLLSKDVEFKRLGLLIVDEEQRFGVAHKERLKALTIGVDVLSMTATPIPRTLQMSMAGVRDLSVIETPPSGRMAIQTYLVPFRANLLSQAIRHELRREGQVFVVHNNIATLPSLARGLSEMVPEARIVIAHGKMPERQLESVMMRFVHHEADVLLTTTIIENGLDIPRANTIIVNRADHFGLAQLYQLRGRVGRSHEHAFAYFLVPGQEGLSDDARRRLKALQEFSELGAGFRLAAADLEIRGAGELLGSRQSGQIAALGFDLYCQMLERAVQELRGEPVDEPQPVSLHLGVDIKIPEGFLADSSDRLVIYKRLAQARTSEEVDRLQAETEDRYGHLPAPARTLFDMGRLRLLAESAGVKSVDLADDRLQIRFHDLPPVEPLHVMELAARERGSLTPSGMLLLPAPPRGADRIQVVGELLRKMLDRSAA